MLKRVCLLLLVIVCTAATCFAEKQDSNNGGMWKYCDEIREFADPDTERILLMLNSENYSEFSRDFSPQMKEAINPDKFKDLNTTIKTNYGNYVSKEFISAELRGNYIAATYKGMFSQGQDPVLIRVVFSQENGKTQISGFWFNPTNHVGNINNK